MTAVDPVPTKSAFRIDGPPVQRNDASRRAAMTTLDFGAATTDHMATIDWNPTTGWHNRRVVPYGVLGLSPTAGALHYGQVVFEGLKAFRADDGVHVFRPLDHARRFASSAERLAMPPLDEDDFLAGIDALLTIDEAWVPSARESALYLRPMMLATEEALGFRPSLKYRFCVFGSPTGPFYSGEARAIKVWVSRDHIRAARGGTGEAKCIGNYGGSLLAHTRAVAAGCDQVLWLDAFDRTHVEELGGMNLFFVYRDGDGHRLVTPPLNGTILPGVTRATVITMAREAGVRVDEASVDIADCHRDAAKGDLVEVFACGTAAVIVSIGQINDGSTVSTIADGTPGPVAGELLQRLVDVQQGFVRDHAEWRHPVAKVGAK